MENVAAFQVKDLAPSLRHPFSLNCGLSEPDAQAPIDLAEQPEESCQYDGLDQKDPAEGNCQIHEDPLAEGAILSIGLICFSCSFHLLQHHDQCSNHGLLAELASRTHHIHIALLLLDHLVVVANLQHGSQLVESLDRQGFGAEVSCVVTAWHCTQCEQLSLQCLLNPEALHLQMADSPHTLPLKYSSSCAGIEVDLHLDGMSSDLRT